MDDTSLKHAADTFDQLTDDFLMHYGTPGMHWRQQGPGKRYQSQAVYAQGIPNPDAKVRGTKKGTKANGKGRLEEFSAKLDSKVTDKANFKPKGTFKENAKEYLRTESERFKNDLRIGLARDVDTLKALKNLDVKKLLNLDLAYPKNGSKLENIGKNNKDLNKIAPYQSTIAKDAVLLTRYGLDNRSAQQAALIIDREKAIERGRVYTAMKKAYGQKS